ncbi:succinate dehydrogenase cytochrome b subunit [Nocardioides donggukensis]|uniref:Succinate dehydrogenase cytochrome b subunit n=1 Tax=Nocardioides donggukensis TaxID=2774019 RepID=A0A927K298_9ACTN|nr:succinate dehydrogenase cytochrome b subunit [Nocardioides donggukensis]MBD8868654.1 succinate dehydrogenase cytochrome b subunit [Nocardioides donggukensis]
MATPTLIKGSRSTRSTIALKLLMAVTGLVFIGYVLLHMYGNLKVFAGQEAFDEYAHHLRTFGEPMLPYGGLLWTVRVVLLLSIVGHAYAAFALWARAGRARTQKYVVRKAVASTLSSKMMRWGGVALLLFVIFHLLHFTTQTVHPGGVTESPYERVVNSFAPEYWYLTVIYLLAMVALAMHLRHGVWSASQTLGLTNSAASRTRANLAGVFLAVVIAGGFALVPLSILLGLVD